MKPLTFQHPTEAFSIRRVDHNGEDWFIARDICDSLGIKQTTYGIAKLDAEKVDQIRLLGPGGKQLTYIVSESGLYAMILRSDKPAARVFRKWVTSEVLPSLRRNGIYSLTGTVPAEEIRVRRLELMLRAAKLRAEAAFLDTKGSRLYDLPGGIPINLWLVENRPELVGRQIGNMSRKLIRWARITGRPCGRKQMQYGKPGDRKSNWLATMLPEHIVAFFQQPQFIEVASQVNNQARA